jgi:hypothetical protein
MADINNGNSMHPPRQLVNPQQMLRRGLRLVNVDGATQKRRLQKSNVRVFKAHYGIHPNQASMVWRDILINEALHESEMDLLAFFLALHFLRVYGSEDLRASLFKIDKWKMRPLVWSWVAKIRNLKALKICFPPNGWDTPIVASVDGTMFRHNEPRHATLKKDPSSWYSHKHHCADHWSQCSDCGWHNVQTQ